MKAGSSVRPVGVDDLGLVGRGEIVAEGGDQPVAHEHVGDGVEPGRRVDDAGAADDEGRRRRVADREQAGGAHHATASRTRDGRWHRAAEQDVVEHRHPHHEARADLLGDQRRGRVGDDAVDLDAAVHRPRVHHELAGAHARRGDAVALGVLAQARDEGLAGQHPLALHPQHVDDVGRGDRVDVVRHLDARLLDVARDQAGGPDQRDAHPAAREGDHVRAGDARVQDVADDRDVQALEPADRLADRVQVEQRLGRMLVLAVAGVHHRGAGVLGDEARRADLRVADHEDVRLVGVERQDRVLQRLALVGRAAGRLDRHHVGREPLRGELERRRRARRALEEHVHDRAAPQGRQLLDLALADGLEARGEIEQPLDVRPLQIVGRQQVATRRRRGHCAQRVVHQDSPPSSSTSSTSSTSISRTATRSRREVGRFLPTKSARNGSSRWPRSQSTASRTRAGRP